MIHPNMGKLGKYKSEPIYYSAIMEILFLRGEDQATPSYRQLGTAGKSCHQPKPSKSQSTSNSQKSMSVQDDTTYRGGRRYSPVVSWTEQENSVVSPNWARVNTLYLSFIEILDSTKQCNLSRKSIPEGEDYRQILLLSAGQSRKSCCQSKSTKSHHISQLPFTEP